MRAALNGRVLILDGVEKAERNVLPILNNLLENREMQLDDGRFLVAPDKYDKLLKVILPNIIGIINFTIDINYVLRSASGADEILNRLVLSGTHDRRVRVVATCQSIKGLSRSGVGFAGPEIPRSYSGSAVAIAIPVETRNFCRLSGKMRVRYAG